MKKILMIVICLMLFLTFISCGDCGEHNKKHNYRTVWKLENGYTPVYAVCLDGVEWYLHKDSLAPRRTVNDKLVSCGEEKNND